MRALIIKKYQLKIPSEWEKDKNVMYIAHTCIYPLAFPVGNISNKWVNDVMPTVVNLFFCRKSYLFIVLP